MRIRAQSSKGDIPLGNYCQKCDLLMGLDGLPILPYKMIALQEPDPRAGIIRKIFPEDFMKILDHLQYNRCTCKIPEKIIDPDISLEDRLKRDHEEFMAAGGFEIQVRHNEIKEAAGNQEFIK